MCPLRGQSLESRLAAQRRVVRIHKRPMVSTLDLLVVGAWLLAVSEMLLIGNLHPLCRRLGFQAFSVTGPEPVDAGPVAHLAKCALKAKPAGEGTWLVRPMFWLEYGKGSSVHPFCGVGVLSNERGVWKVRVRGGVGIALFLGVIAAAPLQGQVGRPSLLGQLIAGGVVTTVILVLQTVEARRVFGRIW